MQYLTSLQLAIGYDVKINTVLVEVLVRSLDTRAVLGVALKV